MYYPVIVWDYISWAIMATLHATKKKLPRFFEVFFGGSENGSTQPTPQGPDLVSKKSLFRKFITDVWLIWFESALKQIMLSPELKIQMCLQTSPKNNENHTTSKSRIQIRQLNKWNKQFSFGIDTVDGSQIPNNQLREGKVLYPHYLQGSIYPNGGWGHGISEPSINRSDGSKIQL